MSDTEGPHPGPDIADGHYWETVDGVRCLRSVAVLEAVIVQLRKELAEVTGALELVEPQIDQAIDYCAAWKKRAETAEAEVKRAVAS